MNDDDDDGDSEDVDEGSDDDEGRPDRQTVEPPWQRIKHLAAAHLSTQEQTCQPKSNLTVKQDCQPKSNCPHSLFDFVPQHSHSQARPE